jgi:carbohydrate kinase (thermoresistant glucokinase family)
MGVAGSGKTTVGRLLARRCGAAFVEADDHHPPHNVAKMTAGIPLTDDDRRPWLGAIGVRLTDTGQEPVVVSCSALKRAYRDFLRSYRSGIWFVHLAIDETEARARVAARPGHFMPVSLIASQFAILEPLTAAEAGTTIDASLSPEHIVHALMDDRTPAY